MDPVTFLLVGTILRLQIQVFRHADTSSFMDTGRPLKKNPKTQPQNKTNQSKKPNKLERMLNTKRADLLSDLPKCACD